MAISDSKCGGCWSRSTTETSMESKTGCFQHLHHFHAREAEPLVGVHLAGGFDIVAEQIENDQAAARRKIRRASESAAAGCIAWCRTWCIKATFTVVVRDGKRLEIALPVVEVLDVAAARHGLAVLHHFAGRVHRDNLARALREQQRQSRLARADIGDDQDRAAGAG